MCASPVDFMRQLTKHRSGSLRELWTIAWPLILTAAANMLMLLGDRIVLSHYSTEAFNANLAAMPWVWTAYFPFLTLVMSANVLVGRYNGSGELHKIGPVIWQVLWFSAALFVPLIAISYFLAPYLLAGNLRTLGVPYLRILLPATPLSLIAFGALASFFAGRGKTRFVSIVSLSSNLLNFVLDYLLVFGIGPFPEMGICGAAWGTIIAEVAAVIVYAIAFFSKKNRATYAVFNFRFDMEISRKCVHIGAPNGFAALINFVLWSWIYQIMAGYVSAENFTAFGVSNSFYCTLLFFIEGVSAGVGTIAANGYGAGDWNLISRNSRAWLFLAIIFSFFAFLCAIFCPKIMLLLFLGDDAPKTESFFSAFKVMLWLTCLALIIGSVEFNLRHMLTSFGDAYFIMVVSLFGYAGIVIFPSFIALRATRDSSSFLVMEAISQIFLAIVFFLRYRLHWLRHRPPPPV
ncbi:MAG: MATE family efflux transporter [Puniceicoccales bacterium]|jgi:MATE family multidrug resistance protein|nr:MATE family efflux transporter [Puniceicoccales bacterium]